MPKISIIIPCYNSEQFVDRCLKSIINQTIGIDNLQIILVDDASTDNTYEKLREWELKYPENILLIHNEQNQRQGTCRNIGFQYASGEYIGYVDIDDWLNIEMYEKLVNIMDTYQCDVVSCQIAAELEYPEKKQSKAEAKISQVLISNDTQRCKYLANAQIGYCMNNLFRKQYLAENNIYYIENLVYEDKFFQELVYLTVNNICFTTEPLYHYFVHQNSISKNRNAKSHYDIVPIIKLIWEEMKQRGYQERFREMLEYRMITDYYFIAMQIMIVRFDYFPLDMFHQLKQFINKEIPDILNNPYLVQAIGKMKHYHQLQINMLESKIPEEQLNELASYIFILMKYENNIPI